MIYPAILAAASGEIFERYGLVKNPNGWIVIAGLAAWVVLNGVVAWYVAEFALAHGRRRAAARGSRAWRIYARSVSDMYGKRDRTPINVKLACQGADEVIRAIYEVRAMATSRERVAKEVS